MVWIWGFAGPALSETLKCKSETKGVVRAEDNLYQKYFLGVTASEGTATCENGETATVKTFSSWYASFPEEGFTQAYIMFTFKDAAVIIMKTNYTQVQDPKREARWLWEGTGEIINGGNRFQGIKGSTSYKGKQLPPDRIAVTEYTITYTLPQK
jgi:hypothetical protein